MSATAMVVAGEIASKGFGTLFSELVKKAVSSNDKEGRIFDLPASRFEDHLNQTFDRCTRMKTLLSRDVPIDLLHQYVHIQFQQVVKSRVTTFDDFDVIDLIRTGKRATIQGTAGGGKTVFMRYLWISYFVNPEGRIPVFLELRRLNELSNVDIMTFVFRNIITNDRTAGMDTFYKSVGEGKFIFVFDGFDEISEDRRDIVEKQILELSQRYKGNVIVVSGRPDSRFDAWQDFSTFRVKSMEKKQVVELVRKVDFDNGIKSKFIDALNKDLYEKHSSFLSSPLLATMMLLTFSHYAEIPEKIHVFYDLAFDTLFSKHDALKEAFNRKKYTGLPIDVFKRRFSFFCLLSYIDEKYEFTRDEIANYINKSAKLDGVEISAESLIRDLLETVCMMHEDGLDITFTHRSFQEYFTAYCLSRMPTSKLKLLMPKISGRRSDTVFVMILDMNKDLTEEAYVLPAIRKAKKAFKDLSDQMTSVQIASTFGIKLILEYNKEFPRTFQIDTNETEANHLRRLSETMYPNSYKDVGDRMSTFREVDKEAWRNFPLKKRLGLEIREKNRGQKNSMGPVFRIILNNRADQADMYLREIDRNSGELRA